MKREKLTRRRLLQISAMSAGAAVAAACAPAPAAAPASTAQSAPPAATTAPTEASGEATAAPAEATAAPAASDATAAPTSAVLQTANMPEVPRNRTVVHGWSLSAPVGVSNPWASPGYTHQEGNCMLFEPLFYYAVFGDKELPWLAESGEYNADFTQLTIKLRPAAMWSDGTPFTSKDVLFTFEGQLKNEKLNYHAQFVQFVKEYTAPDAQTVIVTFNAPAPRFKFEILSQKFDTGIPMVPEHVLSKQEDVNAFYGGLDMPHTGPYSYVFWDINQKILDYREDWWAVKAGIAQVPDAKRQIYFGIGGQVGSNMQAVAQRSVNNEFDDALGFPVALIKSTLESNPKITTHTGNQPPYGYLDWWPNSLWLNHQLAPFSDVKVRSAISHAINRPQLNEVVYEGAEIGTIFPWPLYPGLVKFNATTTELQAKYEPGKYDLEMSAKLMEEAGFTKNGNDLWEKDGATVPTVIHGFEGIHGDVVPIIVEQLLAAGFDASVNFGPDANQSMIDGKAGLYMLGHGASLLDPYATFALYHSKFSAPAGSPATDISRYENPEYDKIVDAMAILPADDPKFQELALQAMEIYWRDVIDIPVVQFLHRIPYNQTYWTNWPTAANVANGFNGAFWHTTGPIVVTNLKAV